VFDIDISVCMSCQICVEVCPFEAIKMDKDFELSKRERFDALLFRKEELSKSNEYYHRIHPVERRRWTRTWQLLQLPPKRRKSSGRGSSCETRNTNTADPTSWVDIGRG